VYRNAVYDGLGSDLWTVSVILYNLLTNQVLYRLPHPSDLSFRYYILARGLSSRPVNERTVEVLMDCFRPGQERDAQAELLNRAMAHLKLGDPAVELLENLFALNPADRWTLGRAMESAFLDEGDGDGAEHRRRPWHGRASFALGNNSHRDDGEDEEGNGGGAFSDRATAKRRLNSDDETNMMTSR
jgi:serine/threonine protein kinase